MNAKANQPLKMLLIGQINGIFGIKGWVKVFTYTDQKANICRYKPWHIYQKPTQSYTPIEIITCKPQGKTIVAQIKDITTCELANAWLGTKLYITQSQLPKATKDEYYWDELIGMQVINTAGLELGVVKGLLNSGANDILSVKNTQKIEHLIPYHKDYVIKIDTNTKIIIVNWQQDY